MLLDILRMLTGWKHVRRGKTTVWYRKLRHYEQYPAYDYREPINKAFAAIEANRDMFGRRAVIRFNQYFSTGRAPYYDWRTGQVVFGHRRIIYTISPK